MPASLVHLDLADATELRVGGGRPEQCAFESGGRYQRGRYGDEPVVADEWRGVRAATRAVCAEPDEGVGGLLADVLGQCVANLARLCVPDRRFFAAE